MHNVGFQESFISKFTSYFNIGSEGVLKDILLAKYGPHLSDENPTMKGKAGYLLFLPDMEVLKFYGAENLGGNSNELKLEFLMNAVHLDDRKILMDFWPKFMEMSVAHPWDSKGAFLNFCYRIIAAKGAWMTINHCLQILETDSKNLPLFILNIMTPLPSNIKYEKTIFDFSPNIPIPLVQLCNSFLNDSKRIIFHSFSAREKEILSYLRKGLKSQEIAEKLHLSKYTVDNHRKNLLRKAGCTNTAELINATKD